MGSFIISLDFELHWGAIEKWAINDSIQNRFSNTRDAIPKILEIFENNNIHATWATVGFLFAKDKLDLIKYLPNKRPNYLNHAINSYNLISEVLGESEESDKLHYASSIIKKIQETKGQEIASHTFSHYYCNEEGQSIIEFKEDLLAAQKIARENFNFDLKSLVFPRNQVNKEYLDVIIECGFKAIRTNPDVWFWKNTFPFSSILRAIDTLMPISNSLSFNDINKYKSLTLIPASRFFRPYSEKEKIIQARKIARIMNEMKIAAKEGRNYHLWWHPHNFGNCTSNNLLQLNEIIIHFNKLNKKYNFQSKNMAEFTI